MVAAEQPSECRPKWEVWSWSSRAAKALFIGSPAILLGVVFVVTSISPNINQSSQKPHVSPGARFLQATGVYKGPAMVRRVNGFNNDTAVLNDFHVHRQRSACEAYRGIDHPNAKGCCKEECGREYCGADKCRLGPGGASACCESAIPLTWCSPSQMAPCLIECLIPPVSAGEPSNYTVQPPLPAGLSLDEASGVVQGSLGQVSKREFDIFTITAKNGISKATYLLRLPRAIDISTTVHEASSPLIFVAFIVACLLCVLVLVLGICCMKSSPHAIDADSSRIEPQPENSVSPLLFAGLVSESARSLKVCNNGIPPKPDSSNTVYPSISHEITAAEIDPQHPKGIKAVALIWDTRDGEQVTYARKKPLGVQFNADFPLRVKREPQGHGKELGIEVGWILLSVNGIDVTQVRDFAEVNDILYREIGEKTIPLESWKQSVLDTQVQKSTVATGVSLVWDTPDGERAVYATKRPLGVQFQAEFPLKVKREPEGHSKEIGVKKGWILKSANGIDVTAINDIAKVNEILYKELGEKTVPMDEWAQGHS